MRRHARAVRDEVDAPPKKARKQGVRLRRKLCFSSSLKFGDQRTVGDRDFDNSGVGSLSPKVLLLVRTGVFRQGFEGDLGLGLLFVGGLTDVVLAV